MGRSCWCAVWQTYNIDEFTGTSFVAPRTTLSCDDIIRSETSKGGKSIYVSRSTHGSVRDALLFQLALWMEFETSDAGTWIRCR